MIITHIDASLYGAQLAAKRERIERQFSAFSPPPLEVFASPPSHYRMRAEFRIWHEGDDLFYAMFEPDPDAPAPPGRVAQKIVRIDTFPVASQRINELMPQLLDWIRDDPLMRRKLFQVEFLTTLAGAALVTMIYHKPLDETWEAKARELQAELGVSLIGRSRKQRLVLDRDHVWEHLDVEDKTFVYQQVENSFTQPNAEICRSMLAWARDVTRGAAQDVAQGATQNTSRDSQRDLVELYCGNGNFTIALAENFRRVVATEISRTSVASAQANLAANAIDNVHVARMSAEEFAQALRGEKQGRRVAAMQLDEHDFSTVLVDPPRAGLDEESCEPLMHYSRIVYISCNPDTLAVNLTQLTRTHRIVRLALFDQFPWTDHCECGVLLERRETA